MKRLTLSLILVLAPIAGASEEAERALAECRTAASQKNEKLALAAANRAEALWTAIATAAPDDATPHVRLGQIDLECRIAFAGFMEKGRLMGSIEGHLGRALAIDPRNWDAHLNLGVLLYNVPPFLRRTDDAIRHLENAIEIDAARSALPYALLGDLYERSEKPEKAAAIRREGSKRFPEDARFRNSAKNDAAPAPAGAASSPAGDRDARIGRIAAIAEEYVARTDVPGLSLAVVRGDDVLTNRGFGLADVENGVPATDRTVYRLGSISKQFLAATILRLEEKNVLRRSDPVTRWLDDVPPQASAITIHHLLTHTAGLPLHVVSDDEGRWIAPTLAETGRPGERTGYSNAGYALAGAIVERATTRAFFDVLREEIFVPAGMEQTSECDEQRIIPHRAQGYAWVGDRLMNDDPLELSPALRFAGGLCSSTSDLVRWFQWLTKRPMFEAMTALPTHSDGSPARYGYGFRLGETDAPVQHSGAVNGFLSRIEYHPAHRLLIVVLINSEAVDPAGVAEKIRWTVLQPLSR